VVAGGGVTELVHAATVTLKRTARGSGGGGRDLEVNGIRGAMVKLELVSENELPWL